MGLDLLVKRESSWKYSTSASAGVGLGLFAASGGLLRLANPSGDLVDFHYASVGGGLSKGFKTPKFSKFPKIPQINLQNKSGAIASTSFDAQGIIFVTHLCGSDELTVDDIRGPCFLLEIGVGVLAGYSGSAFLVGVNPSLLAMGPVGMPLAMASAKGLICTKGWNAGLQIGGGVTSGVGFIK